MVYVSKMVAVPAASLPRAPGQATPRSLSEDVFLAFGRVFAGQLRDAQKLHVLSAAYSPSKPNSHRQEARVRSASARLALKDGSEMLKVAPESVNPATSKAILKLLSCLSSSAGPTRRLQTVEQHPASDWKLTLWEVQEEVS